MAAKYITFGKDRYHEHREMEQWCAENIGKGQWIMSQFPSTWKGMGDLRWTIHSMFGNTTFAFRSKKDYAMFLLRWS